MEFELIPYIGVKFVHFGMERDKVGNILGEKDQEIGDLTIESQTGVSYIYQEYFKTGVSAYYHVDGTLKAIQFFEPSIPVFKGIKLLNTSYRKVNKIFKELEDNSVLCFDDAIVSRKYGICLEIPDLIDTVVAPVKFVTLFEEGYYDFESGTLIYE
ncbi:hypothetical protein [Mechercharimyces sp. CAU 1602]|uniref:hypothetical protein n=1 Tax=Mechercharimyces sp. CAU 1602 TaxID=2973933 RepID=UPI002163399E|nr:hypothetical protein [Mechercharimyces sp. CAU 1602]MCS1350224.1 hypothetical protein [Mechercharimyces sp. CAU 1602]